MSITSASSVFTLAIPGVYDTPQRIEGFSADDVFDFGQVMSSEIVLGLDGRLTGGWVPTTKEMNVSLLADSPSIAIFDTWYEFQERDKEIIWANGLVVLGTLKAKYSLTRGALKGYTLLPDAKRTLQSRKFSIVWESIGRAPY